MLRPLSERELVVPTFVVQRFKWFPWYDAGDGRTSYTIGRCVQNHDVVVRNYGGAFVVHIQNHGGTGPNGIQIVDYALSFW